MTTDNGDNAREVYPLAIPVGLPLTVGRRRGAALLLVALAVVDVRLSGGG